MATEEPTRSFGLQFLPQSFSVDRVRYAENADSFGEPRARAMSNTPSRANRSGGSNDDETRSKHSFIFDLVLLFVCKIALSFFSIARPFFAFLVVGMFMYTFQLANNVTNEISMRAYPDAPAPWENGGHRRFGDDSHEITPWLVQNHFSSQSGQSDVEIIRTANQLDSLPDEKDWLLRESSYDRETYFQRHQQLIPKILHKVILTVTGEFPEPFLEILNTSRIDHADLPPNHRSLVDAHLSWRKMNPEYEIRYYNLHLCRSYLRQFYHPIFLRAFDCIEAFSAKSDFFRTLVVYRDGGFYSDWKQVCMVDGLLKWLSSDNTTWFSTFDSPGLSNRLQCAFFGAPPGSPVLSEAVRISLHKLRSRADLVKYNETSAVFHVSGPGVFGDAFYSVGERLGWKMPWLRKKNHQTWDRIPGVRFGDFKFLQGKASWLDYGNRHIILHKCHGCGFDQSWSAGNNYLEKFAMGEYFCPDAPSLFLSNEKIIDNTSATV